MIPASTKFPTEHTGSGECPDSWPFPRTRSARVPPASLCSYSRRRPGRPWSPVLERIRAMLEAGWCAPRAPDFSGEQAGVRWTGGPKHPRPRSSRPRLTSCSEGSLQWPRRAPLRRIRRNERPRFSTLTTLQVPQGKRLRSTREVLKRLVGAREYIVMPLHGAPSPPPRGPCAAENHGAGRQSGWPSEMITSDQCCTRMRKNGKCWRRYEARLAP